MKLQLFNFYRIRQPILSIKNDKLEVFTIDDKLNQEFRLTSRNYNQLTDIFNNGYRHRFGNLHVLADGYRRRVMMLDVSLVQPVTDPTTTAPIRAVTGQPVPDQFHPVPRSVVATRYPVD